MTKRLTTTLEVRELDADFQFGGSRSGLVFSLLRARTGMLVKLNLLIAVFAVPAIVALYLYALQAAYLSAVMPYSASFGVGYPVIKDAAAVGAKLAFENSMRLHFIMTGAIALLCVALSGAFYVMRALARGEIFPIFKTYFIGVKRYAVPFLCATPFVSGLYFLLAGGISAFGLIPLPLPLKVILLIVIGLAALITASALIFYFTQVVTFKTTAGILLKNSFIFAIRLLPRTLIVLAFTVLPFILLAWMLSIELLSVIGVMLALAFLFSYIVLVWTVYAHWAFDRYLEAIAPQGGNAAVVETTEAEPALAEPVLALAASGDAAETQAQQASHEAEQSEAKSEAQSKKSTQENRVPQKKQSSAYKFNKSNKK